METCENAVIKAKNEGKRVFISHRSTDAECDMRGFLNSDNKLHRPDNEDDISYIYDTVFEGVTAAHQKLGVITAEIRKLIGRYKRYAEK